MPAAPIVVCPHCHAPNRAHPDRPPADARCGKCKQPLFAGQPAVLDGDSFDRHVGRSELPVLVDFWAPWCGPCRMMAPAFEAAARQLEPALRLAKLDTEAHPELAARFGIRSIPTLVLFKDGREVARQSGAMDAGHIAQWVKSAL